MDVNFKFGTKEWAPYNLNFMNGCSNNCVYCYAKEMAIRFKRKSQVTWKNEEPVSLEGKSFSKKNGRIMIPSSHDITPTNIDIALTILQKLLSNGNDLLIVSKPHYSCIERIVDTFPQYKEKIQFRFTIGSSNSAILKLWEPGAPDFSERLDALIYAYQKGFSTSISCEPLLDDQFDVLYQQVKKYVTGPIWIGKMNFPKRRVKMNTADERLIKEAEKLSDYQCDENMIKLYNAYYKDPLIKWKESIMKVIVAHQIKPGSLVKTYA